MKFFPTSKNYHTYQSLHGDVSYVTDACLATKVLLLYLNYSPKIQAPHTSSFFNLRHFMTEYLRTSIVHRNAYLLVPSDKAMQHKTKYYVYQK